MRFQLIVIVSIIVSFTVVGASQAEAKSADQVLMIPVWSQEVTEESYSFSKDPLLLEWSFEKPLVEEKKAVASFTGNISAYTAAADECGKSDGITASGKKVADKRTLACPKQYAFGTKVHIEGMGEYTCEDRGGAIKVNKFDIYMETKSEAFAFGRRNLEVSILK